MRAHRVLGFLLVILLYILPYSGSVWAQQYVISTIAGGAPPATPFAAPGASIGDPTRLATDAAGNVYFGSLHSVFKVDATGTLTRFAGNARAGNSGDGGAAASAQLSFPMGIAVDAAGNVFVADRDASVVRKIAANGTISTVAGTGTAGFAGDGGAATSAQLNGPLGVAVDAAGNLYIADTGNEVVRLVSTDGTIGTFAGTAGVGGYLSDGGAARNTLLNGPEAVAVDAAGNLYIADTFNGRIRRVGTDGVITTVAGVGSTGIFSGEGGPAKNAALSLPTDVAVDRAGNVYIADFGNSKVRVVTDGIITTAAGRSNGAPLIDGEAAVNARLEGPTGVTVDRSGIIYFVEAGIGSGTGLAVGDYKVWKVSTAGILTTLAGNGIPSYSEDGVAATAAQLNGPSGVAVSRFGVIYVADTQNQRVRATSMVGGFGLVTLAGNGTPGFNGEIVLPRNALLNGPAGVAADDAGNWYVADTANNRVRKVQPGGNLFTIAGNGNASYFGDGGLGTKGSVNHPEGVAADAAGNVYIADTLDHAVRKVTPDGVITTLAGTGNPGYSGDGGPAKQARLSLPRGVAVDASGNVYVADSGNNQVRRIDALGTITTVDTGGALADPRGVAVDRAGNLYIADTGNHRVRRVSPGSLVTTIAGDGTCCYSGDGGLALGAQLNQPWGLAVDANGNVYVADAGNNAIRILAPVSAALAVSAVTNAASNLAGAVAPGELLVLYGSGLGGAQTVLFNGVAGPLQYAMPGQVGAVAPYAVSTGPVQVVVQGAGAASAPVSVSAAATAPGVFTADGSGRGPAAAVNQDGTRNGTAAPAAVGSILSLFATGEGQTLPAGVDGKLGAPPLPQPVALVTVTIGGVAAEVRFAGGALGQIAGVMQVNVVVPGGLSGSVPVVLTVGGVASQPGVTVAVK
jgi:trimeric autotransporter adhesin